MSTLRHYSSQMLPPFDEMVRMAERDPEAFEQFRHEMAKEMITEGVNHAPTPAGR